MIREIQLKDKEQWEDLYKGYADFYKVEMNNKILQTVWNWLHDKNHEVDGLVYEVDGNIVGLAHYRRMPSPLRGQDIGFLDDLFVDPKYRGQKIGEKLINKMNDDEIYELADNIKDGIPFATPVFDGAKEQDVTKMLELADLPKSGQTYLWDGRTGDKFDRL